MSLYCMSSLGTRQKIAENTEKIIDKFVDATVLELIDREYGSLDETVMPMVLFDEEKITLEACEFGVENENIQSTLLFLETRPQGKIIATASDGRMAIDVVAYKNFRSNYPKKMVVDNDVTLENGNALIKGTKR